MRPSLPDRLHDVLKAVRRPSRALRAALVFAAFVVIAVLVATVGRTPDLSQVKVAFLSGSKDGNYYSIVAKVAAQARIQRGRIENLASAGSVENIERLAAAKKTCSIQFAGEDGLRGQSRIHFS